MERNPTCTLCGRELQNPSRASICSQCLLEDVRTCLSDPALSDPGAPGRGEDGGEPGLPMAELAGRYTGEREHARGGMGRILLAHDEQLGRDVVIKELLGDRKGESVGPPAHLAEPTPLAVRFVREARIAGQLEHPSIIPVHELGVRENGDLYYTMKYVQGVSLSQSLDRAAGLKERLRLLPHVLDVCQAIAYAHSRGVIHRDIKPANIMVGEFGETVVLDWGLACVKGAPDSTGAHAPGNGAPIDMGHGDGEQTAFGEVLGTPAYMAPEQAQGRANAVDERTDVYALGALLYTLLTGQPPYSGENRNDVIRQAVAGAPEPVRGHEPQAPLELVAICEKAMAADPVQRYPSARALAEELQRFLTGGLVGAYYYGLSEHLWRFARRHRRVLATAVVAFILINAVAIYAYLHILGERDRAVEAQNDASQARDEATQAREETEQQLYETSVALSYQAVRNRRPQEAQKALRAAPETYRHWEWGLLAALANVDLHVFYSGDAVFTPDGRRIATIPLNAISLWDAETWEHLRTLPCPDSLQINGVRFGADSRTLVAADTTGLLLVWDTETGGQPLKIQARPREELSAFAIDPRGETVAAAAMDGTCALFSLKTGEKLRTFDGSPHPITGSRNWPATNPADFSPDGRLVAAADQAMVIVWDPTTGRQVFQLTGHEGAINGLRFSPDGRWIATASADRTARLWSAETGEAVRVFEGHMNSVVDVRVAPDNVHLFTCSADRTMAVWDLTNGMREQELLEIPRSFYWFDINFPTARVMTRALRSATVVRSLLPLHDELEIGGHTGPVTVVTFSPDARIVATAEQAQPNQGPSRILLWDAACGRMRTNLEGHREPISALAFLSGGTRLLSGSADGAAMLWDVDTARKLRAFACHTGGISALVLAPDEKTFATGSGDGNVRFWDLETGDCLTELASNAGPVLCLAQDPEGRYLAAGTAHSTVVVWDAHTREVRARLTGLGNEVRALAFRPDGRMLAVGDSGAVPGSEDTTPSVTLWDTEAWASRSTLKGPTSAVVSLQFHPDERRLAAGSQDGSVRIWDPDTGREVFVVIRDRSNVNALAWSPDGMTLAAGGSDGSAIIRHAFPWRAEGYPGDSSMALEERILLARAVREQHASQQALLAPQWDVAMEERKSCRAQLLEIDDARLAWAEANHRSPDDMVVSAVDLRPYQANANNPLSCPSGGTCPTGRVQDLPSCSLHGELDDNPVFMKRFDELQNVDELAFKVILARLSSAPYGLRTMEQRLNASQDENTPLFQAVLTQLCNAAQTHAGDLTALAWRWTNDERRFHQSAIRLVQRATELEPELAVNWRTLGHLELKAGDAKAAVTHFRKGFEVNHTPSAVGLSLALFKRGQESDITEAWELLAAPPDWENTMYTPELLEVLQQAPPPSTELQPRIEARLKKLQAWELNSTAWTLVTSAERDPVRALELATEAVALTERQDAAILDTLAKALAENGRLEEAIRTQQEALEKNPNPAWRADFESRLKEYERALALQKIDAAP